MHATKAREKRISMRFNKVFEVVVGSAIHGDTPAVARNISAGGMLVEMFDPLPLGSPVTVHFSIPGTGCDFVVRAEVKHQYCYNYAAGDGPARARGVGLRFIDFVTESPDVLGDALKNRLH